MINDALVKEVKRLEKELADTKEKLEQLKVDYKDAEDEVREHHEAGEKNTETFNKLNEMYKQVYKENVELKVELEFRVEERDKYKARLDKVVENNITLKQENQAFRESRLKRKRKRLQKAEEKRKQVKTDV